MTVHDHLPRFVEVQITVTVSAKVTGSFSGIDILINKYTIILCIYLFTKNFNLLFENQNNKNKSFILFFYLLIN